MAALFPDQPVLTVRVRVLAAATAAICWAALVLQLALIARELATLGDVFRVPALAAVVVFLSFFTLQVNVLAASVATRMALGRKRSEHPGRAQSAILVYMWAGSVIFALALQPYWTHRGLQVLADVVLHYVTPLLYAALWLMTATRNLRWHDPLRWLIYPALYLVAVLLLGRWSGFYPYPVIDVRLVGGPALAFNLAAVTVTFLATGLALVALARALDAAKSPN